jgi:hypothetical protein
MGEPLITFWRIFINKELSALVDGPEGIYLGPELMAEGSGPGYGTVAMDTAAAADVLYLTTATGLVRNCA